jgi:hypothetical protein
MPNAREADVNDIGVCYKHPVVRKPLTDKCITPQPRELRWLSNNLQAP